MKKLIILPVILICLFSSAQSLQINWQNCFGGSDFDDATDLIKVNDGYVLAGYTSSNDGDIGYFHGGMNDIWLVIL
jgi:hypothetical protein